MLVAERGVTLTIGDRRVHVSLAVAADLARVSAAAASFARRRAWASRFGPRACHVDPSQSRAQTADVRRGVTISGEAGRYLPSSVPAEVQPSWRRSIRCSAPRNRRSSVLQPGRRSRP
jgi:hypothetical protein